MYPENNMQNYNQQPVNNGQYQMNNNQTPNNEKKISKSPIIIIVIVLAIAVVLGAIFLIGNIAPSNENTTPPVTDNTETNNDIKYDVITEEIVRNHKVTPASDFTYEEIGNEIRINSYIGNDEIVVIPETINGKEVTEVSSMLFANDSRVRGVYIPKSLKELMGSFVNNNFIEVVISEGIEVIGANTFNNCPKLHTVVLGNQLKEINENGFFGCKSLKELYISSTLTNIDESIAITVFFGCTNLTIKGETGSYIESFCKEYNIPFEAQ